MASGKGLLACRGPGGRALLESFALAGSLERLWLAPAGMAQPFRYGEERLLDGDGMPGWWWVAPAESVTRFATPLPGYWVTSR